VAGWLRPGWAGCAAVPRTDASQRPSSCWQSGSLQQQHCICSDSTDGTVTVTVRYCSRARPIVYANTNDRSLAMRRS
jgi:hypothetical protein